MPHTSFRRLVRVAVVAIAGMLPATGAAADITAFVAATTQPANRPTFGVAAGMGLVAVGFEVEFASANEAADSGAPSLRTGMVSGYVQNPIPVAGLQFYGIAGAGVYRERFGDADAETNVMTSVGGGVKMSLAGPLKLRVDYRVLLLRGEARYTSPKRLYAGLTMTF